MLNQPTDVVYVKCYIFKMLCQPTVGISAECFIVKCSVGHMFHQPNVVVLGQICPSIIAFSNCIFVLYIVSIASAKCCVSNMCQPDFAAKC